MNTGFVSIERILNSKLKVGLVFILWTLFITNLWLPRNWGFFGSDDWDLTYATFESARKSIVEYRQWPGFNPYLAFGSDMDANPQSAHASIFFIPILIFGTFYGYKVAIIAAILIGLFGMQALLKGLGLDNLKSVLLSMLFCSASYFSRHIMEAGHSNFLNFYLVPYLFYFLNIFRLKISFWSGIIPTLILTHFISAGAPFAFIVAVFLITLWTIGLILTKNIRFIKVLGFFSIVLFSAGLSLWKIIPVLDLWTNFPRTVIDDSSINLLILLDAFADFKTDTGTPHGWHEISLGIGLLVPVLILFYRKHIANFNVWIGLSLLSVWLSMGNTPSLINPWYLLHHYFPVFDSLRSPYRFLFIALFALVIGLALIVNKLEDNKLILIIILSLALSNTLNFNAISRNMVFSERLEAIPETNDQIPDIIKSNKKQLFLNIRKNKLVIDAYEPQLLSTVSDTLQSFSSGALVTEFKPNFIRLKSTDSIVKLSLRHSSNWSTSLGKIENANGLLSITKLQANQNITLTYLNDKIRTGVYASLITLLLASISFYTFSRIKSS